MANNCVIVAPLDWGLGHATRCIPIINECLEKGDQVLLASAGASLALLQQTFPQLPAFQLPPYNIRYGKNNSILPLLKQIPHIKQTISAEYEAIQKLVQTHHVQTIISDNRYGCWSPLTHNVFICHQIAPIPPPFFRWIRPLMHRLHLRMMHPFHQVWIPDDAHETDNLSGSLSHGWHLPDKFTFIGALSRFKNATLPHAFSIAQLNNQKIDLLVVLSGPEPQRTILEEMLIAQLYDFKGIAWIVCGNPTPDAPIRQDGNVWLIPHLDTSDMHRALVLAEVVLSRSGYSSLMDYAALSLRRLVLIPTPGQTEQEYLANQWVKHGKAFTQPQATLNIKQFLTQKNT